MKNKGLIIGLIIFLVLLVVSLIILMTKMMNGNLMLMFNHSVSKNKILEKTYDDILDINIDGQAADVYLIENKEDNMKVVVYSEQKRTTVNTENNKLVVVSNSKKCRGFCFNTKIDKIEVYIPSNYKNTVKIKSDAGDIKVEKFKDLILNIDIDAGDIDVDSVKKINIKADAGDIKIGTINEYLNIKADAGDIKIEKLNITKNSKIKTDAGDIKIKSTNDIYIDAKTNAGDAKINKNNRKSDVELEIKTDAGDIKVN